MSRKHGARDGAEKWRAMKGREFRAWRKGAGARIDALAKALGKPEAVVSDAERNDDEIPTAWVSFALAVAEQRVQAAREAAVA